MGSNFDSRAHSAFQGRDDYDGVRFPPPLTRVQPARQLLALPKYYTNNHGQLAELDRILMPESDEDGPKVVIVRGAPGSGRSTLAMYWVNRHSEDYPDGHFVVRLGSGAERAGDALAELLRAAGYSAEEILASLDGRAAQWRTWTAGKRIALVIDDALSAAEVIALMPGKGRSAVLAIEAGSLAELAARYSAKYVNIDPLSAESAKVLLRGLLGAEPVDAQPSALDALVQVCAGSAAALTIAGSVLMDREWSVDRLVRTLEKRGVLSELPLSAIFDVAYARLGPVAKRCYGLFGAHPGDGDVAEETIAAALGESEDAVVSAMRELVRARMVVETTEGRYLMSSLLRLHAQAKAADGHDAVLRAVLACYRASGLVAESLLLPGRGWVSEIWPRFTLGRHEWTADGARNWLGAERVNLAAAVEAAYQLGLHEYACQLCLVLWPVHLQGGQPGEMAKVNARGVEAARASDAPLAEAVLGFQQGFAYRQLRNWDKAFACFKASEAAAHRSGSATAEATAVESRALVLFDQGLEVEARELFERNLGLALHIGVDRRSALARFHLAKVLPAEAALPMLDEAYAVLSTEPVNRLKIELWRGKKLVEAGELDTAGEELAAVVSAAESGGHHLERVGALEASADLALARNDIPWAKAYLEEALEVCRLRGFTGEAVDLRVRLGEL